MNRNQRRALAKQKDPESLIRVADQHMRAGRLDQAEAVNREAIARDPRSFIAHNNLGNILRHTGRLGEALTHFSTAFQINPENAVVALNLATGLADQGRFGDAVPFYRLAVALERTNADAHSALAFSLAQIADYGTAEQHYLEALTINPRHFDARVSLGLALADQGKIGEAFEQAQILSRAEAAAGFPHKSFGILLARVGCPDAARISLERHLAANPGDVDEIAMLLATVGGNLPPRASDQQIAKLYTIRADSWDHGAAGSGGYQGHRLVASALEGLSPEPMDTILDAGCGTGLVGELIRPRARCLVGVDMSEPMLAQARQKNVYDDLHCAELLAYMEAHCGSCDAIVGAATLIHFGELDPVFASAARCLRPGGLLVFTVFPNDDDPALVAAGTLNGLAEGGCFRHGADYIARTAAAAGFEVALLRREVHEYARKAAVPGLVVGLRQRN